MDVFLVPAGDHRHQLYCEVATPAAGPSDAARSWRRRLTDLFHRVLAEGERARQAPDDAPLEHGRVRRWLTRKVAETVAEQRVLWHLRRETRARLVHPDDLSDTAALEAGRQLLKADRDKHLRWCVIDALLGLVSAPAALLPGPNVLAYYFVFRAVGHALSWRGARQGLTGIAWQPSPSAHLTALRRALHLDEEGRRRAVESIAAALGLERLRAFVDDVAD